jgi:hypothetical protein
MLIAVKTSAHRTEVLSVCGPSRARNQHMWFMVLVFHLEISREDGSFNQFFLEQYPF